MAVIDRPSLNAAATTDLADNTSRNITPLKLRTIIKNIIDSFYNKTSDPVAIGDSGTYDLDEGETVIEHNLGKTARIVAFKDSSGARNFEWEPTDENTITVTSSEAVSDVEINIVAF